MLFVIKKSEGIRWALPVWEGGRGLNACQSSSLPVLGGGCVVEMYITESCTITCDIIMKNYSAPSSLAEMTSWLLLLSMAAFPLIKVTDILLNNWLVGSLSSQPFFQRCMRSHPGPFGLDLAKNSHFWSPGCLDRCLELAKMAPSYTFPSIGM